MRSIALAFACLATGIHALPRPAVSYAVVNVDGGSAPTSTAAAQTTVVSTVVESEAPTTVSQTVYKTVTESSLAPTTVVLDTSTTFEICLVAIILSTILDITIIITIIFSIFAIFASVAFSNSDILSDTIFVNIFRDSVLNKVNPTIWTRFSDPYSQEQHSNEPCLVDR
ncbi:hypothetical protein D6D17_00235 [Aureobasidium pullulans]|uniref:Uncharacterized protein n=1 Tax=Aureobasidium pullulans TaxID=5580 RepID=A0A4T0DCJ1_AURPU|nr:hypothetical protein D6D22_03329 [Aureobasidium pullulans]THX21127.1 hypothetical protein D6D17_00235 [Aureobasidium pullulans]THX33398.1 hypothetical protein D6D12_01618 [Aureobasidium pullulans]THX65580.1 hypothetical protein D6D11_00372 [Aureobasidium pullulans]THX94442.1 hypothetical protein D6D08_01646 [Aureobasidium pullulans]